MTRFLISVLVCSAVSFAGETFSQRQREFWSFQPVKATAPPTVQNADDCERGGGQGRAGVERTHTPEDIGISE